MSKQRPVDLPRLEEIMKERRNALSLFIDIHPFLPDPQQKLVNDFLQKVLDDYIAFHEEDLGEGKPKMARMPDGTCYRCEVCGANVFTVYERKPDRWYCNGCDAEYIGE